MGEMPSRGGRWKGEGGLGSAEGPLSAERLADLVGTPRASSTGEDLLTGRAVDSARRPPRNALQNPPEAELQRASDVSGMVTIATVTSSKRTTTTAARSAAPAAVRGAPASGATVPVVSPRPVVSKPAISKEAVSKKAVAGPAVSKPAKPNTGRHRRAPSPKLVVRGLALTSYRFALMGALAFLVAVAAILKALS